MAPRQPAAYTREAWEAVTSSMSERHRNQHRVLATLHAEHRYMATLVQQLSDQLTALEQGTARAHTHGSCSAPCSGG